MPELPEVETIRRDLLKHIVNKRIQKVEIFKERVVKNTADFFVDNLLYKKVIDIERIGKLLMLKIDSGNFLLVHLKMTGKLIYKNSVEKISGGHSLSKFNKEKFQKHTHVIITFEDNSILLFEDVRTFGYMKIVDADELIKVKSKFGIEPLTPNFTLEEFERLFKKRTIVLKALLLNQTLISGIGNIYADEISFEAEVHPLRRVDTLTKKEIENLYKASNKIIQKAVEHRGTTFYSYVDAQGKTGNFFSLLKVYKQHGKPCKRCGNEIQKVRGAGRGTHVCLNCQK